MAESRNRLLSGRYRLIHPIGRGGMGTVWWAFDEVDQREVAVKEVHLPPSLDQPEQEQLVRRTNREAMTAGRLRHPGLIAMHDVVVEEGRPWLIMEYVAARSLEDVFVEDGPISPLQVADIGRQLLAGLRAAHAAGIVHRDVKPSNVLLAASGRVVLTDFGIATYEGATTLTQTGTFMGSPAYVAPEVARGERATPAADLWSLGATLYAAVEGRPPYHHETAMATLSALVTAEPDPPVQAGPLRPLLTGLLQKDPERRLKATRAAELLTQAAEPPPPPPPATPVSRATGPQRPPEPKRSRLGPVPVISVAVLALAVAGGVVAGAELQSDSGARPARTTPHGPVPPSSSGRRTNGELPPALVDDAGRPVSRRVARTAGTFPATAVVTLAVTGPGGGQVGIASRTGATVRAGVMVACEGATRALAFTAYVMGEPSRTVSGTCVPDGARGDLRPMLRLPGGVRSQVRIRLRGGPQRAGGSVRWRAGVYADTHR